jgi:hypothetical protein
LENISPIILFVYNRPEHTRKTVESLLINTLAKESELFIFSDGPKNSSDNVKVAEIRSYIKSIKNFKRITIIESKINKGLAESVINGVNEIIKKYGKVIVLEDDLVCTTDFLKFMNEALDFYYLEKKIFSISGYSLPIQIPEDYTNDIYLLPRPSSWGWGTWRDRWESANWEFKDLTEFFKNKESQKNFNRGGEDLTPMLKAQILGLIDSWSIRWAYTIFKKNGYCLYPINSKIQNIGTDKSGTHFKKETKKYYVELNELSSAIKFTKNLNVNNDILKRVNDMMRPTMIRRIINLLKYNVIKSKFL